MKKRRLGKTNINVSELVLGGGYVGGILIHQNDEIKIQALQYAVNSGINFIDTAPSYGDGESERAIGRILNQINGTTYVSTKVAIATETRNDLAGQIERSIHKSLRRLQKDSVDLLQLHNPLARNDNGATLATEHLFSKNGVIDALEKARADGLTKHIGITALGELKSCQEVIASGTIDTAQVYFNLLNPSAGRLTMPDAWQGQSFRGLINTCVAHDVGVMNIRVFAGGFLASNKRTGREVPITAETDLKAEERRAQAVFSALDQKSKTQPQTAIQFALANTDIACVLVGVSNLDELKEAIGAVKSGPLPMSTIDLLNDVYANNFGL